MKNYKSYASLHAWYIMPCLKFKYVSITKFVMIMKMSLATELVKVMLKTVVEYYITILKL